MKSELVPTNQAKLILPSLSSYINKKKEMTLLVISFFYLWGLSLLLVVFVLVAVEVGFGVGDLLVELCLKLVSAHALGL